LSGNRPRGCRWRTASVPLWCRSDGGRRRAGRGMKVLRPEQSSARMLGDRVMEAEALLEQGCLVGASQITSRAYTDWHGILAPQTALSSRGRRPDSQPTARPTGLRLPTRSPTLANHIRRSRKHRQSRLLLASVNVVMLASPVSAEPTPVHFNPNARSQLEEVTHPDRRRRARPSRRQRQVPSVGVIARLAHAYFLTYFLSKPCRVLAPNAPGNGKGAA
jgi:hypothetical protein